MGTEESCCGLALPVAVRASQPDQHDFTLVEYLVLVFASRVALALSARRIRYLVRPIQHARFADFRTDRVRLVCREVRLPSLAPSLT
jgi:hypothetical protein